MPSENRANELRQERPRLHAQAMEIVAKAKAETRELTAEEQQTVDALIADIDAKGKEAREIEASAAREAKLVSLDEEFRASQGTLAGKQDLPIKDVPELLAKRNDAVRRWMLGGADMLRPEDRKLIVAGRATVPAVGEDEEPLPANLVGRDAMIIRLAPVPTHPDQRIHWNPQTRQREQRVTTNPQSTTTTAGGYAVPNAPMAGLEDALLAYGGMRQARTTIIRTATGANLPIPTQDDTSLKGAILAENTQTTTVAQLTFGQVVLGAFKYTSNIIKASLEFLQDVSIDAESFIGTHLGIRIGRITNDDFTFGSNSSAPYGCQWASHKGKTAASATAIAYADLVALKHAVDPSYRAQAEWMFNDNTLSKLEALLDSYGRPLWVAGMASGSPDRVLGQPYVINQSMSNVAAGVHSVMYGDFSKYYIRDVSDIMVIRMAERFIDYGQIGFLAFSRHDGDLVDAGTHPIAHLLHPAS